MKRVFYTFLFLIGVVFLISCPMESEDDITFYDVDSETLVPFWAADTRTNMPYPIQAVLLTETDTCLVYAECNSGGSPLNGINESKARDIAREYQRNIMPKITGVFGEIKHITDKEKTTLLLLDIRDGYNDAVGGGYVGGYFSPDDMEETKSYSNKRDMLSIDTFPGFKNSEHIRASYATVAHELQHLINYSNTVAIGKDEQNLWINEGLSTAAEYVYGGDPASRVIMYNIDYGGTISKGNNFFVWRLDELDQLANYSTAYLFFQWLRIHAGNDTGIYKEILNSPYSDYQAVTEAARTRIPGLGLTGSSATDWEILLQTWMLANAYQSPAGFHGYKNKISEMTRGKVTELTPSFIEPESKKMEWNFQPGEGIFTELDGPYTPPAGSDTHIRYVGLANRGIVDTDPPYTGLYLLTFNADANWRNGTEKGYLANTLAPDQEIFGRARASRGASNAPARPFSYPVDAYVIREKWKRENGDSPVMPFPAEKLTGETVSGFPGD
jgi:hypothetical protein